MQNLWSGMPDFTTPSSPAILKNRVRVSGRVSGRVLLFRENQSFGFTG